ncbi:hypothetical protein HPP92_020445 [Vanilla planifolia]|uniref:Uncharacterized protein n=1 Tax=Vanilla planifolia TaxID=51239 RepID=A0A835Q2R0_VANPL|nr:hypothetical protein HPP92_020445 [Vanilla planifolia]
MTVKPNGEHSDTNKLSHNSNHPSPLYTTTKHLSKLQSILLCMVSPVLVRTNPGGRILDERLGAYLSVAEPNLP